MQTCVYVIWMDCRYHHNKLTTSKSGVDIELCYNITYYYSVLRLLLFHNPRTFIRLQNDKNYKYNFYREKINITTGQGEEVGDIYTLSRSLKNFSQLIVQFSFLFYFPDPYFVKPLSSP